MKILSTLAIGALATLATAAIAAPATAQLGQRTVLAGAESAQAPRGDLFIQGLDSVWTATGEVLTNVSIRIEDGEIREIGPDIGSPDDGATVIDGRGLTAMPGIVDEHSHSGMDRGTNEGSTPISAEVRVADALRTDALNMYQALSGGVTTSLILHGSANPIGGESQVIKMRYGLDSSTQLLFDGAPRIIKFALGENVTQKNWSSPGEDRFPISRQGVEAFYVQAFTAAQEYREAWERYRDDPGAFRVPPRRDLRLETLVDIMEGEVRVHAHSYRSDEIVMLMRIAERFGFRIDAFTHVLEGYKVADELAEHGAGASTFSDWWMYKLEAYDAIPYNAAIMHGHGVLTSLNSDIPWLQSFMVYEMNKPVKYGDISREDALRMLTLYPAMQLRVDDRVGSIEVGKDGDIVLLNGDPFDAYTRVEKTIVDGIVYYDLERDAELRGYPVREMPDVPETMPVRTAAADAGGGEFAFAGDEADGAAVTALVGATVHPVAGPSIPDGVVVMQGERIAAIGRSGQVDIPAGAARVDVSGRHVYPGMIDPLTQLGMVEIGSIDAARDDRETGDYNPHIRGLTGVHPHSVEIPVTRANGITAVLSVQASGVVQGTGSVIQLAGDTPEKMAIADRAALVVDFPSPPGDAWDDPELAGDAVEELIDLFERARDYTATRTARDDPTAPFRPNVEPLDAVLLEAMVPAVTGESPVLFQANRERDIRTLLLFLDEFPEVDAVLVGGGEAFRVAEELAEREIPVVVGTALRPTSDRHDPVDAAWRNAAVLYAAGVDVAFTAGSVEHLRNLPYHAARSAAFGLPREAALRAVTLAPAEMLGLGDAIGSLEPGKRADLIVTDGDPLQIVTEVERMWIAGEEVPLESKHTRLWERFRNR
ncbi:MAG: amidohydrolase family protein [Gemmatimonadota bacterium]